MDAFCAPQSWHRCLVAHQDPSVCFLEFELASARVKKPKCQLPAALRRIMRAKNSGALMSLKPRTVKNPRNSPVLPFGTLKSSLAKSVVSQLHERTCEFSDGH